MRFGVVYHIDGAPSGKPVQAYDYTGFYGGVQAGFGGLISQNAGARNFGQTLDAQRAGSGATGGVFGGYGLAIGALYLGAEAEAEISNADWNIKRDRERPHLFGAEGLHARCLVAGRLHLPREHAGLWPARFRRHPVPDQISR